MEPPLASDYVELHRPQFHFTPEKMWMSHPGGLVYDKGEYHLFYQYDPDTLTGDESHWGHAVSRDLVHWEHLPVALSPDALGALGSGSAIVDERNTGGFKDGTDAPLVALYTQTLASARGQTQHQSLAFSTDRGRTWTKYPKNPVIANPGLPDFRDPRVIWHPRKECWILVLAAGDCVRFYQSANLKEWSFTGEFGKGEGPSGGVWGCPDLFPMKTKGTDLEKWVLIVSLSDDAPNGGSGTRYFIGDFDGNTFVSDAPSGTALWLDWGCDNTAGATWSNAPDNRKLFIGWMSNWQYARKVPTRPWRGAMTVPRELVLNATPAGLRLFAEPVKELESLRGKLWTASGESIQCDYDIPHFCVAKECLFEFDLVKNKALYFGVELFNVNGECLRIGYDATAKRYYIDRSKSGTYDFSTEFAARHTAPRFSSDKTLRFRLWVDAASVEFFADNGATGMTDLFFPNKDFTRLRLFSRRGRVRLVKGRVYEVRSIWKS